MRAPIRRPSSSYSRVTVKRSFDRISVDGQLSTERHRHPAVQRQVRGPRRAGDRRRAPLRRALDACSASSPCSSRGTAKARGGSDGSSSAAGRAAAVSRVAHAVAHSPLVKTALYGGDPELGTHLQAVGMALPGTAPLPVDVAIEGVPVCSPARAFVPHDAHALAAAVQREEVEYEIGLPEEGAETELYFSDLGTRIRDHQRGLHDMRQRTWDGRDATGASPHRDHTTLLEALPYIREFYGQTVVIKYGGAAMVDPGSRRVRPRRRAAEVRRHEPDRRPRRWPGDHELDGAARAARRVRRRPARLRRRDRRGRQDGARRQGEQGHRPAARPPRPARRRPLR